MTETWSDFFSRPEIVQCVRPVLDRLAQMPHAVIYPPREKLFAAFLLTPMDQVRAVILGQDPYHGPNQAQGLSFSVPADQKIPPSLQNIYKELSLEYPGCDLSLRSGDLSDWARQGVLLLNTILTVEAGKPLSHQNLGWKCLSHAVLEKLNSLDQPIVFFLWGAQARSYAPLLTNPNHLVLESVHPSPLSAHRGFFGSNQFRQANEWLAAHGSRPIDWCAPNRA